MQVLEYRLGGYELKHPGAIRYNGYPSEQGQWLIVAKISFEEPLEDLAGLAAAGRTVREATHGLGALIADLKEVYKYLEIHEPFSFRYALSAHYFRQAQRLGKVDELGEQLQKLVGEKRSTHPVSLNPLLGRQ